MQKVFPVGKRGAYPIFVSEMKNIDLQEEYLKEITQGKGALFVPAQLQSKLQSLREQVKALEDQRDAQE